MTKLGLVRASLFGHRWVRNVIAIFSVVISMALLTVSLSMVRRLREATAALDNGRLIITAKITADPLTLATYDKLGRVPGLKPRYYASVLMVEFNDVSYGVMAVGPELERVGMSRWWSAPPEAMACVKDNRNGVIVDEGNLRRLGWKVGQSVAPILKGQPVPTLICGKSTGENAGLIFMRHDYLLALTPRQAQLALIISDCDTPDGRCTNAIAKQVDETTATWATPTQTIFEHEFQDRLIRVVSAVPNLVTRVSLLAILITMLITASTLSTSLEERQSEFATLRAIGYRRGSIFSLILMESLMLCGAGGLLGAGIPFVLYYRSGFSLGPTYASNVTIHATTFLMCICAAAIMGIAVSAVPALRTARKDVISSMREG